jgi:2-aminoethylphosphonate-pyruvate transaminase
VSGAVSAIQTAVILAAGRGTRLTGELTDRPKGFIRIGVLPIVEESIERLVAAGIRDVIVVTGHLAHHYEELARRRAGVVRIAHNQRFADSGSMYSLYCARALIDGPFLLLESDLVYEPRALATLLEGPAEDAILLSGPTGAGDEVFVATRDGFLAGMSKRRADLAGSVAGELVGITRISPALFALMCAIAVAAFRRSLMFDYETGCLVAAGRERPIACPLVPDLLWGEIDDPGHLARVRDRVYPELQRRLADSVAPPRH